MTPVTLLRFPKNQGAGKPLPPLPIDPDQMLVDEHTYRDLEVFQGDGNSASLYDLFNSTRTIGGAKALKARMKKPWSKPAKISAVQESIRFILEHRARFEGLPKAVVMLELPQYLSAGLPLAMSDNGFEFILGALEVRFGNYGPWNQIVSGVGRASRMIRSLRALVRALPEEGKGEISALLNELRGLLKRPGFAMISDEEQGSLPLFTTFRLDRMIRLKERKTMDRILEILFQVDALVAMADATKKFGFILPKIVDGPLRVEADGVFNPFVEKPVGNPVQLDQNQRMLFLTGPNMAGKTTYLRSCGTAVYLAHLGMGVPAQAYEFSPCERLFSSLTITESVRGGVSFFRAEALRMKVIVEAVTAGKRVVALMDEPFKGTNVKDALDASLAVMERLSAREGNLFLISSHLIELGDRMLSTRQVDCRHFEANEHEGSLRFEYVLRNGVSSQRLGMRVLEEEGLFDLLDSLLTRAPEDNATP